MKISIIGADGQLGSDICELFEKNGDSVNRLTIKNIDISSESSIRNNIPVFAKSSYIINTAAFHNPPLCEKNPQKAFRVNAIGSFYLANACLETDIPLLHFSTDYVFNGEKRTPYTEEDVPKPINVYGNSKLAGEFFISSILEKYYILRVSGIFGKNMCIEKGYNFVDKMLEKSKTKDEIRVVDDETLSPTFTEDIAQQTFDLIHKQSEYGLYHVTSEGSCSWFEFAKEIFNIKKIPAKLKIAVPYEFSGVVKRPKYSVLENKKLKDQGLNIMPHWKEGLKKYLDLYR